MATRLGKRTPRCAAAVPVSGGVGARVKALREAMSLSLRELAERSGVSAPMLSQVERGETSPTLAVAERVAAGLDLSLAQLLRLDEGSHLVVTRRADRRRRRRDGHGVDELTPPLPGQRADVSMHTLRPGAATGGPDDRPLHEPGSRETAVVLEGVVELVIEGEHHRLQTGDSVTFDSDLPHHFHNNGGAECRFLAVVAAGLRRS